jgi:hypothetical protein
MTTMNQVFQRARHYKRQKLEMIGLTSSNAEFVIHHLLNCPADELHTTDQSSTGN